jgi:hypothetical protein
MAAPALTVYANGPIAVSADQLNTFMQTCDTATDMRGLIGVTGMSVAARGIVSPNDGLGGMFYWNVTSTGPDDDLNTIVPLGARIGAWVRYIFLFASGISPALLPVVGAATIPIAVGLLGVLPLTGGTIAAPGTFTNLAMNDTLKIAVNGASDLTEFQWSHPGNFNTSALSAAIIVPASASVYAESGIASYVQNQSTSAAGASGGYFYARNTVAGGTVYGLNPLVTDQNSAGTTGVASTMVGAEFDIGAFNPLSTAYGINMIGVFPNGSPMGGVAYQVSALNFPWLYGFLTGDGACVSAMNIGSMTTTANSDGQPINLAARDASNVGHLVAILASHAASGANLTFNTPTGGVVMSGLELVGGTAAFQQAINVTAAGGTLAGFFSGATPVGSITTGGTTTAYNTTSDYRLKTIIGPADGNLIDQITVHTGAFKAEPDTHRSMMLAHELQPLAPWAVVGEKDAVHAADVVTPTGSVLYRAGDPIFQMVDFSKFVPDLIAKCQALQGHIDLLTARVAAAESRITPP